MPKKDLNIQVVSRSWNKTAVEHFFKSTREGTLFGYSQQYSLDEIRELAQSYGRKIRLLRASHPLRKMYGKYVVEMRPGKAPPTKDYWLDLNGLIDMRVELSKNKRKCKGHFCSNPDIPRGQKVLVIRRNMKIAVGQTVIHKNSYCKSCGLSIVGRYLETMKSIKTYLRR